MQQKYFLLAVYVVMSSVFISSSTIAQTSSQDGTVELRVYVNNPEYPEDMTQAEFEAKQQAKEAQAREAAQQRNPFQTAASSVKALFEKLWS